MKEFEGSGYDNDKGIKEGSEEDKRKDKKEMKLFKRNKGNESKRLLGGRR